VPEAGETQPLPTAAPQGGAAGQASPESKTPDVEDEETELADDVIVREA